METQRIQKSLTYTKQMYETIADQAKQSIEQSQDADAKVIARLYGIYYNAMAGLLRSGVLCSRVTGTDGFPEIRLVCGSKNYQCDENILRTILGDEAEFLILPYEDTFESYVNLQFPKIEKVEDSQESVKTDTKNDIKALKREHQKAMTELKKQYEAQIADLKKASAAQPIPVPAPVLAQIQDESFVNTQEFVERIKALEKENQKLESENAKLQKEQSAHADKTADYEQKLNSFKEKLDAKTKELAEKEKYVYDPNYDHYYSEELPELVDSIQYTHKSLLYKFIALGMCVVGLGVSAVLFL